MTSMTPNRSFSQTGSAIQTSPATAAAEQEPRNGDRTRLAGQVQPDPGCGDGPGVELPFGPDVERPASKRHRDARAQ